MDILAAKRIAQLAVGNFSRTSKMPCYSWSIPAQACKTGFKLAKVDGSICQGCYALRGNYTFPSVVAALRRRLRAYHRRSFVDNFVTALTGETLFRWFDSGDLQSVEMLEDIAEIAKRTPRVRHWLPTKEIGFIRAYLDKHGKLPSNLIVRVSAYMIDQPTHARLTGFGSIVISHADKLPTGARACPAPGQGGQCGDCRACWSKSFRTIAYHKH